VSRDMMLELAKHIVETKKGDFDPSAFEDHYELAVVEMVKCMQAGLPAKTAVRASSPSNVII
jgi:non-homologous end joining protein Ku